MTKKGHRLASWKERWFILKHGCLSYFTNKDLREQKGVIMLNASWKIEVRQTSGHDLYDLVLYCIWFCLK